MEEKEKKQWCDHEESEPTTFYCPGMDFDEIERRFGAGREIESAEIDENGVWTVTFMEEKEKDQWVLDIETLGTTPSAVVVSIGAFPFARGEKPDSIARRAIQGKAGFELLLDVSSQIEAGRTIDLSTVKWWFGKVAPPVAARQLFGNMATDRWGAGKACETMRREMSNASRVWCRGTDFDLPALDSLFADYIAENKQKVWHPWNFWEARDLRTHHEIFERMLSEESLARVGEMTKAFRDSFPAHGARNDAAAQAYHLACLEHEALEPDFVIATD